jgi:hypothetical protein
VCVALRAAAPLASQVAASAAGGQRPVQPPRTPNRAAAVAEPTAQRAWSSEAGSSSSAATTPAVKRPAGGSAAGLASKVPANPSHATGAADTGGDPTDQDVAAVLAGGRAGMAVCWRGFRAPAFEERYGTFRSRYLRGWDWLCRGYSLLQCVLLTRAKWVQLQATGASAWGMLPGELGLLVCWVDR